MISKGKRTSGKWLELDVASAQEGLKRGEISNIGLLRSKHNLADGFRKRMKQANLQHILATGKLNINVE